LQQPLELPDRLLPQIEERNSTCLDDVGLPLLCGLDLLASGAVQTAELLSAERPLEELEDALRSMMRKEALKVVIRP